MGSNAFISEAALGVAVEDAVWTVANLVRPPIFRFQPEADAECIENGRFFNLFSLAP